MGLALQNLKISRLLHNAQPVKPCLWNHHGTEEACVAIDLHSGSVNWRCFNVFGLWHRRGSTKCGVSPSKRHDLSSDTELFVRPTQCCLMPPVTTLTSATSPHPLIHPDTTPICSGRRFKYHRTRKQIAQVTRYSHTNDTLALKKKSIFLIMWPKKVGNQSYLSCVKRAPTKQDAPSIHFNSENGPQLL